MHVQYVFLTSFVVDGTGLSKKKRTTTAGKTKSVSVRNGKREVHNKDLGKLSRLLDMPVDIFCEVYGILCEAGHRLSEHPSPRFPLISHLLISFTSPDPPGISTKCLCRVTLSQSGAPPGLPIQTFLNVLLISASPNMQDFFSNENARLVTRLPATFSLNFCYRHVLPLSGV